MNTQNPVSQPDDPTNSRIIPFPPQIRTDSEDFDRPQDEIGSAELPNGFRQHADGIYELRPTEDGGDDYVRICSPLFMRGLCRKSDGSAWGRVVDVKDPDGGFHRHILDEAALNGRPDPVLRSLCDMGLVVEPIDKAAQSVGKLLQAWRPETRFIRIERCGWTNDDFQTFVLANGTVIGDERVVVAPGLADAVAAGVRASGSLPDWRDNVAALCVGNSLMTLAVSHAFTGPLLQLLGMEGGGFHLRGASARGKTTLLTVAASVWGEPTFVQSWRATDNGIEGLAAACSGTLLVLDELAEVCPSKAGEIIYMLANGKGKARAQQDGSTKPAARWHVPLLSSGEVSAEAHMATAGKQIRAGQEVRLIDIAADTHTYGAFDCLHCMDDGNTFVKRLKDEGGAYHGTGGPAFVTALIGNTKNFDLAKNLIQKYGATTLNRVGVQPDEQVNRVLSRFMLAAVAGELATIFGLTGWQKGAALLAAREEFRRWCEDRDKSKRADVADANSRTRAYLAANRTRFTPPGPVAVPGSLGWHDGEYFYIPIETWKTIHAGFDSVEAARLHQSAGLLKSNNSPGLQFKMGRKMPNRPNTYAVKVDILPHSDPN